MIWGVTSRVMVSVKGTVGRLNSFINCSRLSLRELMIDRGVEDSESDSTTQGYKEQS